MTKQDFETRKKELQNEITTLTLNISQQRKRLEKKLTEFYELETSSSEYLKKHNWLQWYRSATPEERFRERLKIRGEKFDVNLFMDGYRNGFADAKKEDK